MSACDTGNDGNRLTVPNLVTKLSYYQRRKKDVINMHFAAVVGSGTISENYAQDELFRSLLYELSCLDFEYIPPKRTTMSSNINDLSDSFDQWLIEEYEKINPLYSCLIHDGYTYQNKR